MSKAKKNILFAALAALALTVCLVGVTGAYFIAQACSIAISVLVILLLHKTKQKSNKG